MNAAIDRHPLVNEISEPPRNNLCMKRNRVLFHSNLIHKPDNLRFAKGFENRRMNVTMLFGKRG